MIKKILLVSVVTLLCFILIGIKTYPYIYSYVIGKSSDYDTHKLTIKKDARGKSHQHRDTSLPQTFPFERKEYEELAKKYPDKFAIVKKMYYSWDFIDNASGEYESGYAGGEKVNGWFSTDFIKKQNRAQENRMIDGKVVETENILFTKGVEIRQLPDKKIYTKLTFKEFSKLNSEEFVNEHVGLLNRIVTNSEWYVLLYNNYQNWSYKISKKYGMPTFEIRGNIPKKISEELEGPFEMTVSKDTGALLDLQCYGKKNETVFYVKTKNIKINQGIDQKAFRLNVSDDQELALNDYISQTFGANAYTDKKTGWDK